MTSKTPNSTKRSVSSRRPNGALERHRVEVSAGGLVFRRAAGQNLEFAMVMDSYGKWAFPKGHARQGEVYERTAMREIGEEIGLSQLRLVGKLGAIDIWFRDRFVRPGLLVHKYIYYFLFEASCDAVLHLPNSETNGEHIRDVAWVPAGEVFSRSSYKDMIPIIKKAFALCGLSSFKTLKPSGFRAKPSMYPKATP